MEDIGIFASLDPVANDQAFIDFIWNSEDEGKKLLKERIEMYQGNEEIIDKIIEEDSI